MISNGEATAARRRVQPNGSGATARFTPAPSTFEVISDISRSHLADI